MDGFGGVFKAIVISITEEVGEAYGLETFTVELPNPWHSDLKSANVKQQMEIPFTLCVGNISGTCKENEE